MESSGVEYAAKRHTDAMAVAMLHMGGDHLTLQSPAIIEYSGTPKGGAAHVVPIANTYDDADSRPLQARVNREGDSL